MSCTGDTIWKWTYHGALLKYLTHAVFAPWNILTICDMHHGNMGTWHSIGTMLSSCFVAGWVPVFFAHLHASNGGLFPCI